MSTIFRRLSALSLPLVLLGAGLPACELGDGGIEDDGADGADDADSPGDKQDGLDGPDGSMDGADDDGTDDGDTDGDAPDDGDGDAPDDGDGDGPDGSPLDPDAALLIDASVPDASLPVDPPPVGPFDFLSEAGLYSDIENHVIAPGVLEFEPEFKLWSDGAEKRRWIRLPPGGQINTTNMGSWRFPVGTILYKEFSDPLTGKRLETRVIQRRASGPPYYASFIWNEDDTEAVFDSTPSNQDPVDIPDGCAECDSPPCDVFPTSCHVVPRQNQCNECHGGETHNVLGFSAVQLSHDGPGLTLTQLAEEGLLTVPPPPGVTFPVPGTAVERAAIGYLHANCAHCHAPNASQNVCFSLTNPGGAGGMQARVMPGDDEVEDTQIFRFAVDQPLRYWIGGIEGNHTDTTTGELITRRIEPGDAERSAVWYRMSVREFGQLLPFNDHQQMPTTGTNEVDEVGLGAVETWINSL